jgi:outer membrane protein insertion porin family
VILNVEYRFGIPFFLDGLGGASFYDTGTVFDDISDFSVGDFTHTLGFGLRYRTPIGPIRVDYGVNVNRQPGERSGNFTFTLGHAF